MRLQIEQTGTDNWIGIVNDCEVAVEAKTAKQCLTEYLNTNDLDIINCNWIITIVPLQTIKHKPFDRRIDVLVNGEWITYRSGSDACKTLGIYHNNAAIIALHKNGYQIRRCPKQ